MRIIPIEEFGRDHWSTLAYIASCFYGRSGEIAFEKMRTNPQLHPQFATRHHSSWNPEWSTRLKDNNIELDHDDWHCVDDLIEADLIKWKGTGLYPKLCLTEKGNKTAFNLVFHKFKQKPFSEFDFNKNELS